MNHHSFSNSVERGPVQPRQCEHWMHQWEYAPPWRKCIICGYTEKPSGGDK